jgi:hypothetical protein
MPQVELAVAQPTPGGGVSDLGGGKIRGPHQGLQKEACRGSIRSPGPSGFYNTFPWFLRVWEVSILSYRVPLLENYSKKLSVKIYKSECLKSGKNREKTAFRPEPGFWGERPPKSGYRVPVWRKGGSKKWSKNDRFWPPAGPLPVKPGFCRKMTKSEWVPLYI